MSKEQLEGVINLCKMVQAGSIDPFDIDFDYVIGIIKKHYPEIRSIEDFCLDANAIKELTSVLERQNQW